MKSGFYLFILCLQVTAGPFCQAAEKSGYAQKIATSKPDRHWSFDSFLPAKNVEASSGPISTEYPAFGKVNLAVKMKNGGRIVIADPGKDSVFDFENGDEITV